MIVALLNGAMNTTTQSTQTIESDPAHGTAPVEEEAREFRKEAKQAAKESFRSFKREGNNLASKAKESVSNAANEKLNEAASKVRNVQNAARDAAERFGEGSNPALKSGAESVASNIGNVADYLENKQPEEVVDDVRGFVKEHPVAVFGTLIAAGFIAGRFLKASSPQIDPDEMRGDVEPHHIPQ